MLKYGPTGALSEYSYKGGEFHGIHYGDFYNDSEALFNMMKREEDFLLKSSEKRRILIDLYNTSLTEDVIEHIVKQICNIESRIYKIAFATDSKELRKLKRAILKSSVIPSGCCFFNTDQDTDKTWLISDGF